MCGISGQYNFIGNEPVQRQTIEAMAAAITHRGPDDEGFHYEDGLGLGFRRLSIIDLAGGHQPMSDAEETVWVVFNGEIYNFPELRQELEAHGHRFRTRSDTEVIVHGYKQWGVEVLNRLNGMFGVGIWDRRLRRLVIARDAAGIKLVYYRVHGGKVWFGSELRAVLAAQHDALTIDPTALNLFLRYRYTPSPLTLFKGIHKLAPGTMAVFEAGDWRVERWYQPRIATHAPSSDDDAAEELLDIYKRALKRHLISDVPVGLLLSGGIDSGLLLGLMSLYGRDWHTYTVGYGKSNFKDDELIDAAETAALFSARNVGLELDRGEFERSLSGIVGALEEPIASSSIVPMYHVCKRARQDVKVALVGQGPDELFGGYKRHLGVQYGAYWRSLPPWVRRPVEAGIGALPRGETLKRGVYSLNQGDRMRRYQNVFSIMPGDLVDGLFRDGLLPSGAGDSIRELWRELEPQMHGSDELGGFQLLELRSSLPDELLMYGDKLSMAHGLEVRVPYLDKEIVEFAQRLPASMKVRLGQRKWLHRHVCERFLPARIINRKKRGFGVNVVDQWFDSSLNSRLNGYLLDAKSLMYDYLEPKAVHALLQDHQQGRRDNHKILFSLVVLEEWLRSGELLRMPAAA
jgi:asparagine synthase (glutamine-hydrolysing)